MTTRVLIIAGVLVGLSSTAQAAPAIHQIPSPAALGERAKTITLAATLTQGYKRNLGVAQAKAVTAAARAALRTAKLGWVPSLQLVVGASIQGGRIQGSHGTEADVSFYRIDPHVRLEYEFNPAKLVYQTRAARAGVSVARHSLTAVRDRVVLASTLAWLELARRQTRLRVQDQSLALLARLLTVAKARERLGAGARLEVLHLRGRQAQQTQRRLLSLAALRTASVKLSTLLGRRPSPPLLAAPGSLHPWKLPAARSTLRALTQSALSHRPELARSRAAMRRLGQRAKALLWGALAPRIGLFGTAGVQEGRIFGEPDPLGTGANFSAGVYLRWNLSAQAIGRSRELRMRRLVIRQSAKRTRLRIRSAVSRAFIRARLLSARLKPVRRFVTTARAAIDLAKKRFQGGPGAVIDVLEAQRALRVAQLLAVDAIVAHNRAQIILRSTLGRLTPAVLSRLK